MQPAKSQSQKIERSRVQKAYLFGPKDKDMTQLLLLGKVEYGGGPIFKVVLAC